MGQSESHIRFEQLVDLAEGRLPPKESARLESLVAKSPQRAAELASLKRMLQIMRMDGSADAPPDVIARATRLFRPGSAPERRPSLTERIVAVLTFDSAGTPFAFGVRGAPPSARQMLFTTGNYELDIRISPQERDWRIAGQVLGLPGESKVSGQVTLEGANSTVVTTDINPLGEFNLPSAPSGTYVLVAHLIAGEASEEIEIPELVLGG